MIDRREIKNYNYEMIEEALVFLSDTEILLNFCNTLKSLYPHLIPIIAFAYDSWDDIVEPLFYQMVYVTFQYKYGITVLEKESHTYNIPFSCYERFNHIECIPKSLYLRVLVNGSWNVLRQEDLLNKLLVFKAFGDGRHFLTGGLDVEEAHKVEFDLVEIEIVDVITGICLSEYNNSTIFVSKEDVNFEFIAETYYKEV
ncbi:hypothetical protein NNC19_12830 [Clostridium sp. SHJSY1]|uniref:hypothetical protein n=1 Tax=Clostridium sp. SHJSY1 TaxID=2942483 RepID=UPI002876AA13|nr:hypothetical protein [Clostridium sp. SHJSY1]MDS0526569.1 hypothetical protein [Clostridium sp. SHJSY1]